MTTKNKTIIKQKSSELVADFLEVAFSSLSIFYLSYRKINTNQDISIPKNYEKI